jgi:hypothetical protein
MSSKKVSQKKIKILLTQGSKGGVGKTFCATQVAAWLKARGHKHVAFDLDTENRKYSSLNLFVPEATKVNIHTIETLDILLSASQIADVVLIDMPAATGYMFFDWFDKMYETCTELGIEFVLFCLITPAPGSVENTLHWVDSLQGDVTYVAVKNPKEDADAKFNIWDNAEEVKEFKKKCTCHEILLPSIRADIMPELELKGLTLQNALLTEENKDSLPALLAKFANQQHLLRWGKQIFTQLDDLAEKGVLLP